MPKPVTIPNTFATATTAIPLTNLDADFTAVASTVNDANSYSNYAADTGAANAYVVTLTGITTTYTAGLRIQFKALNANTTASTVNVNGQGAKNITFQDATALGAGTIAANAIVDVMYDGTQFLLMNDPAGTVGTGDVVGPASATDNAVVRFDGTTGKLVQNSVVTIADSTGDVAGVGALTMGGNLTLSGGTANGVLYLNGSKVATSGSALTFDGTNFVGPNFRSNSFMEIRSDTANLYWENAANTRYYSMALSGTSTSPTLLTTYFDGTSVLNRLALDSSGNLGLGVTPSAWASVSKAFQIGATGVIRGRSDANLIDVMSNVYTDTGGANKYIATDYATYYRQYQGQHQWLNAPSGTAGNTITFTQAMTLDASGNLQIGNTSYAYRVAASRASDGIVGYFRRDGSTVNPALTISCNETGNTVGFGTDYAGATSPAMTFSTGGTERARITSGGDLRLTNSNNIASITQTAITLTGAGGGGTGGQTVNIITANSTTRGVLIVGSTQACSAIFFINAGNAVNLSSQTTNETRFSATSGAANTANVYASGSNIVLENNIQATRDFYVTYIGQV